MEAWIEKIPSEKLRKLFLLGWQFFKFGIVGLSNAAISLIIYYVFIYFDKDNYILGNAVGWFVSVLNAFYWSNKYVFKTVDNSRAQIFKRLLRTYLTYGSTFLLSTGLLFLQVKFLGVSEWLAPIINIIITTPINFLLNKHLVFKERRLVKQ